MNKITQWPDLPYVEWKDSLEALHMKMQVVGKVKLALNPFLNHWWNVAFYLSASGMTTGLIPYKERSFEINFDFYAHTANIRTSDNEVRTVSLKNCTVAEFYDELMKNLSELGIKVTINTLPSEVPDPIHCYNDTRHAYDEKYVQRWWKINLNTKLIIEKFRSSFRGKSSPVQFFWGSFDLSHARYSGKPCTPPNYGGVIMKYGENEENFACGFWPGNANYPEAAFYSYMYPSPDGMESAVINPAEASFNSKLGEFILNYEDIRKSTSPGDLILGFLNSTYDESARIAGWNTEFFRAETPDT